MAFLCVVFASWRMSFPLYAPPFFQHSTFNHRRRSLLLGSLLLLPPRALVQLQELNFAIYNNECQES